MEAVLHSYMLVPIQVFGVAPQMMMMMMMMMIIIIIITSATDRLCGLVVRVPGYRSRDPGSIPGATRFSEK
jgi:hypothetical protein